MKIRALANGDVIEAHEDAAKVLIENGIYEAAEPDEPLSAESLADPAKADAPVRAKVRKSR